MNENTTCELFPVYVKKLGRAVNYVNCHVKEKGFLIAEKEAAMGPYEDIDVVELDCRMDHLFTRVMERCGPGFWPKMTERWVSIKQIYDGLPDRFRIVDGHVYDRKAEELRKLLVSYLRKSYSVLDNDDDEDSIIGLIGADAASLGYNRELAYRLINLVPPETKSKTYEGRSE